MDHLLKRRYFCAPSWKNGNFTNEEFSLIKIILIWILLCGNIFANEDDDEQLLFILPENWIEIYSDGTENLSTTEYAPAGQTLTDWQEMISVQILLNSGKSDPDIMLTRVATHLKKDCDDFNIKPIQLTGVSNAYPSLTMMTVCEKANDSDFGEIGIVRGISGNKNFYLLQKIWRTKPFKSNNEELPINLEQRKFWLGYIAYLGICSPNLKNCPENVTR